MSQRNQLLCLSGGGYRGLFTACVLEDLERQAKGPLGQRFDAIAGTSIGAILATGVAFGIPATKIAQAFRDNGQEIFKRPSILHPVKRWLPGVFSNRYSPDGLKKTIKAILGQYAITPINAVPANLMVVATNRQNGDVALMKSWDKTGPYANVTVLEALLASAAAPTYFPECIVNKCSLVDGGLVANAPDLLALTHWTIRSGLSTSDIDILSIGTAGEAQRRLPKEASAYGQIRWMLPKDLGGMDLFSVTLASQEAAALDACRSLLGSRFLRLDTRPTPEEAKLLGLDKVGKKVSQVLEGMARQKMEKLSDNPDELQQLQAMLRHTR